MIKVNEGFVRIEGDADVIISEICVLLTSLLCDSITEDELRLLTSKKIAETMTRIVENDFSSDAVKQSLIEEVLEKFHEE